MPCRSVRQARRRIAQRSYGMWMRPHFVALYIPLGLPRWPIKL